MKKIFSVFLVLGLVAWIMALASVTGCEVHHYHDDPHSYVCYEEPPFYQSPDYCDYYFAGKCCGCVFGTKDAGGNPEELFATRVHPFIWVTILYIAQFVSIYFLFY
jgi:hypothetical protein